MSRIGKLPIPIPSGVALESKVESVEVKGPKGKLSVPIPRGITVKTEDGTVFVHRADDSKPQRAFHGLTRALLANAITGVASGYERVLEIIGTGYRAEASGNKMTLALGYSHPVDFVLPEGVSAQIEKNTVVTLAGIDKQLLGQVAANLRALRPPDAYKGKGIRYRGEQIKLKPGKAAGA